MRLAVLLSILASVSAVAPAQQRETDLGSLIGVPYRARIPDKNGMSSADRGRVTMQQFAACVLDRSSRAVGKALAEPTEQAQNNGLARLATSECLNSGMITFQSSVMRGAIFTELYRRREQGKTGLPDVAQVDLSRAADTPETLAVYWWLMDFANCVTTRDRAAASGYVVAPVLAERETAALKSLTPALGPCVTANQQITLNRATIKGALAETLYRGARSPSAAEGKN